MASARVGLLATAVAAALIAGAAGAAGPVSVPLARKVPDGTARPRAGFVAANGTRFEGDVRVAAGASSADTVKMGADLVAGVVYFRVDLGDQSFNMQLDTGSADIGVPAVGCSNCGSPHDGLYAPPPAGAVPCPAHVKTTGKSTWTASDNLYCDGCKDSVCSFSITYADQSKLSAELYKDRMGVSGTSLSAPDVCVGAIYTESTGTTAPFEAAPVDGIIGFAHAKVATTNAPTFFEELVRATGIANIFTLCVGGASPSLTLGGLPAGASSGDLQWVDVTKQDYFTVYLRDVMVDGRSIGVPPSVYNAGEAIVDSGTAEWWLPTTAYKALFARVQACCSFRDLVGVCNQTYASGIFGGYCFAMTDAQVAAWPTVSVLLGEGGASQARVDLGGGQLLYRDPSDGLHCLNAAGAADSQGTILGDAVMQAGLVAFDRASHRVGFGSRKLCG